MRTIEITTTQNVVIQVKLATLIDRIVGFVLDLIIFYLLYLLLYALLIPLIIGSRDLYWVMIAVGIVMSFYTLIFEVIMRGQTPGKSIMGIKVIKVDGTQPEFVDYFRRWALRWIDILGSFGAVAITSISTSDKGQRLGDKIADTIVVKKKQISGYELKDILSITSSKTYEPVYPEVRALNEDNMLTLKRLLNRKQKFPNISVYNHLMIEAGQKIEKHLSVSKKEKSYNDFIRQLLKDYVILTR